MNFRYLLIFALLFPGSCFLQAQPNLAPDIQYGKTLRFEAIGPEQGLPHETVECLFQDRLGFIWLGTPIGIVKYDGYQFQTFKYQAPDSIALLQGRSSIHVSSIAEDPNGDLWVGCRFEHPSQPVLFRFDRETETLIPYLFDHQKKKTILQSTIFKVHVGQAYIWIAADQLYRASVSQAEIKKGPQQSEVFELFGTDAGGSEGGQILNIYEDSKGQIWFPAQRGFYRWKPGPDSLKFYDVASQFPHPPQHLIIANVIESKEGGIWLFPNFPGFLLHFDPLNESFNVLQNEAYIFPSRLMQMSPEELWFGNAVGRGGMFIFDLENAERHQVRMKVDGALFLPSSRILSFLKDDSGTIWVGTRDGPLLKYESQRNNFHWLQFEPQNPNSLSHNSVNDVKQDREGNYWISSLGGGLSRWNRKKNTFTHFRAQSDKSKGPLIDYLLGLEITPDGKIWFGEGTSAGSFDPLTGQFKHYEESGVVWTVYNDSKNRLWLAKFGGGLRRYDPVMDDFIRIGLPAPWDSTQIIFPAMAGICEDSRGDLWLGSYSPQIGGFFRFDPETEHFEVFNMPEAHAFLEDRRGYIWIGSVDGLYRFDPKNGQFKLYVEEDGLPNNLVNAIIDDDAGYLWVATDNGLSRFDPETESFRNYYQNDGLPSNEFFQDAYKNEDGELFFCEHFGLLYFHPDSIKDNTILPQLAFTGLDLFGKPVPVEENGPLKKHISLTKEIHLAHWQNDLTIHYAALHYKNPAKNSYNIQLENYQSNWQEVGNRRFANYTNLNPGRYTFRVKAANSDGIWNEEGISLQIIIHAPWYWNGWSQTLYLLLIIGLILGVYRFQLNRRLALAEVSRMKELDNFKTTFYTNITHEFRTPLTIIMGMAKEAIVQRNARRLLHLVNQMLDLSKLESGNLKLNLSHHDVILFLKYISESHHSLAKQKNIELSFQSEMDELFMDFDQERLQQVVSNLLSNALKFSPEGSKVSLTVKHVISNQTYKDNKDYLVLIVSDNGPGILPDQLPYIFDRFYQADNSPTRQAEGTGIGLALTKELVHLMGGRIEVESQWGKGATFTICLPVSRKATTQMSEKIFEYPDQLTPHLIKTDAFHEKETDGFTILIVEDNMDVIHFLTSFLKDDYQLLYANNGKEGIDVALEHIPDIIISDVMMPVIDGFELCATLKRDERSSHIPIILLTARADQPSKIEGLKQGADAYLAKPFDQEELTVRLRNLIEIRQKLRDRYNQPDFQPGPSPSKEDVFVLKVKKLIKEHIDDDAFGIEELSDALHFSRVHLYRKLKSLTGYSTALFIREVRLQEAHRLLKTGLFNVSEVAYRVGYNDPGYFSKLFSNKFGKPPSEV